MNPSNFCNCPNCQTKDCPAAIDLASVQQELEVCRINLSSVVANGNSLKLENEAIQQQLSDAQAQDIQNQYEILKHSGLDGTSHESGWTLMHTACAEKIKSERDAAQAECERLSWKTIDSAPKDGTPVIVALISDGRIWRVSDASFNGLGWYTLNGSHSCHWRTHWMPLKGALP